MLRRLVIPCALAAALAGCGSAASDPGHVTAWDVKAPYLPPPDPSAYAKAPKPKPVTRPPSAPAAAPAATPAPQGDAPAAGAPSDAQVAAELRQAYGGKAGTDLDRAAITSQGLAIVPQTAPRKSVAILLAGNDVPCKA